MIKKLITLIYMAWFVGSAEAAIVLTQLGSDLYIDIQGQITFELNRDMFGNQIGFIIPSAINVAGTGGVIIESDPASEPSILGDGLAATGPDIGVIRGGSDLEIIYFLPNSVSLTEGEPIILTAGDFTLPNFFDFSIIEGINFSVAETVFLSDDIGMLISASTSTVPEPTAFLLCAVAFVTLTLRKRRRSEG